MSTISSVGQVSELAQAILGKFDTNKDGQLNIEEFASVLAGALSSPGGPDIPAPTDDDPFGPKALQPYLLGDTPVLVLPDPDPNGPPTATPEPGTVTSSSSPAVTPTAAATTAPAATTPAAGAPTAPTAARTKVGAMASFSAEKLADPTHTSFKYQIGRILQYYPNTPEGLKAALPEIQKLVPEAKIIGTHGDKIDFGNYSDAKSGKIGVVDVLHKAGLGGTSWGWRPVTDAPANGVPTAKNSPAAPFAKAWAQVRS